MGDRNVIEQVEQVVHICKDCAFRDMFNCTKHKERVAPTNLACTDYEFSPTLTERDAMIIQMIQEGNSYRTIAKAMGCGLGTVERTAKKAKHYSVHNLRLVRV